MNEEKYIIAFDAMGGDNAPTEIVKGVIDGVNRMKNVTAILVGKAEVIAAELNGQSYPQGSIRVVNASEVIETAEHPVEAIRRKMDSSLVVGLRLVKNGEAHAFVSAGNSGAVVVGGQGIVGRIRGVQRPPFAALVPSKTGSFLLLDSGANIDSRPEHLMQWAKLGTIYMESIEGVKNPKVGLVNIGAEEEKGNKLVQETFPLLKELGEKGEINFIGSVEARDVPLGKCDVVVCDGFTGNVLLKGSEGTAKLLFSELKEVLMSSAKTKIGALLIKNELKRKLFRYDSSAQGGAPILGLKGLVVKIHGSAKSVEVTNAMVQCAAFLKQDVSGRITEFIQRQD